jgi:hypothetical protein
VSSNGQRSGWGASEGPLWGDLSERIGAIETLLKVHSDVLSTLEARVRNYEDRLADANTAMAGVHSTALNVANLLRRLDLLEATVQEHARRRDHGQDETDPV